MKRKIVKDVALLLAAGLILIIIFWIIMFLTILIAGMISGLIPTSRLDIPLNISLAFTGLWTLLIIMSVYTILRGKKRKRR